MVVENLGEKEKQSRMNTAALCRERGGKKIAPELSSFEQL